VKKVIETAAVTTLHEMIEVLMEMQPAGRKASEVYVTINSDSVRLRLVEETLTDGSTVYNIELSEVCK
jgi:hypothetical protein